MYFQSTRSGNIPSLLAICMDIKMKRRLIDLSEKYFICEHCGNIITKVEDKGVPVMCCGEKMKELIPGTVDAAVEKHIPVVEIDGNKVTVKIGEVEHPMMKEHYIQWISIYTDKGYQLRKLNPENKPEAVFYIQDDEKVSEVYEYCNLHGLWKKAF